MPAGRTIPSSWKPQPQRQSGGRAAEASAGAKEYTDIVADIGDFHSMGIPQWTGAAWDCTEGAEAGVSSATAPPEKLLSDIVSKHTYN